MDLNQLISQKSDYSSMEIRWFFRENSSQLQNFVQRKFNLKPKPEVRTDIYYPIVNQDDLGLKLRAGNWEIKKRQQPGTPFYFINNQAGYLEYWDKWIHASSIPAFSQSDSFSIRKKRWVLKFNSQSKNDYTAFPYEENLSQGIQVEYAELEVEGGTSYTFCLEVFGDTVPSHLKKITDILPAAYCLSLGNSFGYPAWILNQYRK